MGLGINGFDKDRAVYFISVAPQNANDKLTITAISAYPVHVGYICRWKNFHLSRLGRPDA